MKIIFSILAVAVACALSGCKGKEESAAEQTSEAIDKSVQSAPDPMKNSFAALDSATASGDFAKAKTALDELLRMEPSMTSEQAAALAQKRQELLAKALAAAQQGDAAAARIVQGVRATRGR